MKFLIFAPKYKKNTHTGILVLHDLCHSLQQLGYDASVMIWENVTEYDPQSIVIYPEVIPDNPLNASRVVRYFLHMDSYISGHSVQLGASDFIITWSKLYNACAHVQLDKYFVNDEFNDINTRHVLDRSIDCTWFHKARYHQVAECVPNTINIGANGALSKPALADLLRSTRILYTYDILTNMAYEAIFCGALVAPLSWLPFSREQVRGYPEMEFPWVSVEDGYIKIPIDYVEQRQEFIDKVRRTNAGYLSKLDRIVHQIRSHFNIVD